MVTYRLYTIVTFQPRFLRARARGPFKIFDFDLQYLCRDDLSSNVRSRHMDRQLGINHTYMCNTVLLLSSRHAFRTRRVAPSRL